MGILLAMGVAAATAPTQAEMTVRGRAFAGSLLTSSAPQPYASASISWTAAVEPTDPRSLPTVDSSLPAIRTALQGCSIGKVHYYPAFADEPGSRPGIIIWFDCPKDFAHAYGDLFLDLAFRKGQFTEASLKIGVVTVTPPSS